MVFTQQALPVGMNTPQALPVGMNTPQALPVGMNMNWKFCIHSGLLLLRLSIRGFSMTLVEERSPITANLTGDSRECLVALGEGFVSQRAH